MEEFARGGNVESAIEAAIDNLKGDSGDAMEIINNVLPPAETEAEIIEEEVLQKNQVETPTEKASENDDNDDVSSEAIRYNSKGESIENPKAQTGNAVGCHDGNKKKSAEKIAVPQKPVVVDEQSSSVEEHVQRFDSNGNSIEKFIEASTESEEMVDVKRKNKKAMPLDEAHRQKKEDINRLLNKQVVHDQLEMRQMESHESGFDDDDIPVITIPMGKILIV